MTIILGMLMFYYPLAVVLKAWIPNYSESVYYLGILFPICLFEAKQALLCETYLKNYRRERFLLLINVGTMLISVICSSYIIFVMSNQKLAIYFILFILCFRSTLSEIYLNRFMKRRIGTDVLVEIILATIFVLVNVYFDYLVAFLIYGVGYLLFVLLHRNKYRELRKYIKKRG